MCGISALIDFQSDGLADQIRRMTDVVRHRGPDSEGFALFDGGGGLLGRFGGADTPDAVYRSRYPYSPTAPLGAVEGGRPAIALGHRRLSIVDLSPAGHQPMSYADGRYWIVYNGEIYNDGELRRELRALGHRFVSECDTETLLAAYAQWGEGCLDRLQGMWAFAILDRARRTLFAARDRFGIKPLYYRQLPNGSLALASEIKQFTALPGWTAKADLQQCYYFLLRGVYDHSESTLFEGVRQLQGGQCVTVPLSSREPIAPRRWYALPPQTPYAANGKAPELFRERLADAVRGHMRADVKVGSCLSGGLDSSSIVCLLNGELRALGRHDIQETVSSCFDLSKFDERKYIEQVAESTRVKINYVFPDYRRLFADLPRIVWHQDHPFTSTSVYAQWNVFAEAKRQGLLVMLDGQGADEILAGYHGFYSAWFAQLLKRCSLLTLAQELRAWRRRHGYSAAHAIMTMAHQLLPEFLRHRALGWIGMPVRPSWLQGAFLDRIRTSGPREASPTATLDGESRTRILHTNLPMLLHYEDRDSMAHSVEARVPFLDHRLVEFAVRLPDHLKIWRAETKVVLRRAMKGVLPEGIRTRQDKMGFVTPEVVWLRESASGEFKSAFERAADAAPELFHRDALLRLFSDYVDGRRKFDFTPWRIISFGQWLETFKVRL